MIGFWFVVGLIGCLACLPVTHRNLAVAGDDAVGRHLAHDRPDEERADPPHILYINADDLGVMDIGFNDATFHTPNIDRLAREGMTFTNAYAPAANCAPSRACVHSGLWTPRHGVYTVGNSERGRAETRRLVPIQNTPLLDAKFLTMAEALRARGYRTIHLGKYHIGENPLSDGYEVNVGGDSNGSPRGGYYSPWSQSEMSTWSGTVDPGTHRSDVFTREAIRFLREHRDEPMFIHYSPYLVHTPLTAVPPYQSRYLKSDVDPRYGSMVEKLDHEIGLVLNALDQWDLAKQTLVVFSSDNGGIAAVHSQHPFRGGKGSYYDGGIREPLIVRWPACVAAGSRCDEIVNTLDLFPTFLDASGKTSPENLRFDGVSLMPLLRQSGSWDPVPQYWHFPVYLQSYAGVKDDARDVLFRTRPGSAMRNGKWKLHEYFEDGSLELYDLEADPGERNNLAEELPEKTSELHRQLVAWRRAVSAPVPDQANPAYDRETEQQLIRKRLPGSPIDQRNSNR